MLVYPIVRRFFAPDQGGSPSQGQTGAEPVDPFAGLDLDNLDPDTKAVIEKSKETFATLQKDAAELKATVQRQTELTRKFQSEHDRTAAELARMKGPQQVNPDDAKLAAVEKVLIDKGITPEQAKLQAPIFKDMFSLFATELKGEIGRDLAPLGATVMQNEAQRAWQQAESMDKLAALQIPEIRQKTWDGVQALLSSNQPVTAATVINLRNIYFAEHQENGQQQQQMPNFNQPPPMPNWGGPMQYGGQAQRPPQQQANAPKHQSNSDTDAAVAKVAAMWKQQLPPKKK